MILSSKSCKYTQNIVKSKKKVVQNLKAGRSPGKYGGKAVKTEAKRQNSVKGISDKDKNDIFGTKTL